MDRRRLVVRTLGVAFGLALVIGTGYALNSSGFGSGSAAPSTETKLVGNGGAATGAATDAQTGATGAEQMTAPAASPAAGSVPNQQSAVPPSASSKPNSTQPMIVVTASMDMRVKDINAALAELRRAATVAGGSVSDLSVQSGVAETPAPQPLDSAGTSAPGPSGATATLRVPVAKLADVQQRIAGLGNVVGQTSSESDVTQQHIDMAARLKNLRAEEVRLRSLLGRAGGVSDLLEVERELSRVRGDIESMQAQLAYLENQAAMATLTVTLAQPGALVRPAAATWGVAEAFTAGVQAAAGLVRALITGSIALSPVVLLALLAWGAWRLARRRRGASATQPHLDDLTASNDA